MLFLQLGGLFDCEHSGEPGEDLSDDPIVWCVAALSIFQVEHHDRDVGVWFRGVGSANAELVR